MPAAPPQAIPTGSALPVGVPGASLTPKFQVRVRYKKRMSVQSVYRMVVELRAAEKGAASSISSGDSVIARPIIPGAHVQPQEQELGPKASNNKVVFAVTPLAAGRLAGARIQLLHNGRVMDEVKTPMRGVRPGRVVLWAALTLLALAYLIGILGPLPDLSSGGKSAPAVAPSAPAVVPPAEENPGEKPAAPAEGKRKQTVAAVLSQPPGKLPDYLQEDELPEGLADYVSRSKLTDFAQDGYDSVYKLPNLNFHILIALLAVTLVSLFLNRPGLLKSTRKGKPMMLPSLPDPRGNPLAFGS